MQKYEQKAKRIEDQEQCVNKLCELNVIEQVKNVCHTTIVQNAWSRGASLAVHGWIYDLADGRLRDLNVCVTAAEIAAIYRTEIDAANEQLGQ